MVDVAAGSDLYLAWNISVASGSSPNKAMGLAIDNVVIDATFASQDQSCYIYVEDVTKWSSLLMGVDGAQAQPASGSAVVNGVTYKVWSMAMDGAEHALLFTDNNGNAVNCTVNADGDHYLCLTKEEVTEIADPQNYGRKGSLQRGKDADILMLDNDINLRGVFSMGEFVKGSDHIAPAEIVER